MPLNPNTARIAKNTVMLYIRMLVTLLISLYTSRIVLKMLGVDDYGIYNLVGGIVVLFSFVNTAMTSSTQRFLSFNLGRDDHHETARVFSMSINAHIGIAAIMLLLAETVGLWFVNTQLQIPEARMVAANFIYQFSIAATCINIIRVPYNASIIAHEKMSAFALLSIIETVLKLLAALSIIFIGGDKLIMYGLLIAVASLLTLLLYRAYCVRRLPTCKYRFFRDGKLLKDLMSFSGWSIFGSGANIGSQQGMNILFNIFGGVVVNAAMGVANQMSMAVYGLVTNFQTAFNPQIIKSYAAGDKAYFFNLIFKASKFSYMMRLAIAVPVILEADYLLNLWLVNVPEQATRFTQLILAYTLIDAISGPLWMSVQATGKIRNYQILMGLLIILNIPATWLILAAGYPPEYAMAAKVGINMITYIARIIYLKGAIKLPIKEYMSKTVVPAATVTLFAVPIPLYIGFISDGTHGFIVTVAVSLVCSIVASYVFGLSRTEKLLVKEQISKRLLHK
jgi:O-antigen/teichoic acid export membrane protein